MPSLYMETIRVDHEKKLHLMNNHLILKEKLIPKCQDGPN